MGCVNSSSVDAINSNGIRKFKLGTHYNRNNVNPDQITENIEIIEKKLEPQHINFIVSKLGEHQLFGTLSHRELKTIAT